MRDNSIVYGNKVMFSQQLVKLREMTYKVIG